MWSISGSRRFQSAGSGTTHGSLVFTAPNPSIRKAAWTGTCVSTWASHPSSAACVGRSTHARISWSTTSASTLATSPSTATSVAKASLSRPSSTSTFARTTLAVCLWRGPTASPLRPQSRLGGRQRRNLLRRRKLLLRGRRHRDLCPQLGQIETWLQSLGRRDHLPSFGSEESTPTWQAGAVISAMPPLTERSSQDVAKIEKSFSLTPTHTPHPECSKFFSLIPLPLGEKQNNCVNQLLIQGSTGF